MVHPNVHTYNYKYNMQVLFVRAGKHYARVYVCIHVCVCMFWAQAMYWHLAWNLQQRWLLRFHQEAEKVAHSWSVRKDTLYKFNKFPCMYNLCASYMHMYMYMHVPVFLERKVRYRFVHQLLHWSCQLSQNLGYSPVYTHTFMHM